MLLICTMLAGAFFENLYTVHRPKNLVELPERTAKANTWAKLPCEVRDASAVSQRIKCAGGRGLCRISQNCCSITYLRGGS